MDGYFFFFTRYRQVIICLEELDSICHTRKPNALSLSLLQIIFMRTWLAAMMYRLARPCVAASVKEAVTPE